MPSCRALPRHTAITLIRDLGMRVEQRGIPREFLYIADEVFFTGTAAEITPIRAIDQVPIGCGQCGPITAQIQDAFFRRGSRRGRGSARVADFRVID